MLPRCRQRHDVEAPDVRRGVVDVDRRRIGPTDHPADRVQPAVQRDERERLPAGGHGCDCAPSIGAGVVHPRLRPDPRRPEDPTAGDVDPPAERGDPEVVPRRGERRQFSPLIGGRVVCIERRNGCTEQPQPARDVQAPAEDRAGDLAPRRRHGSARSRPDKTTEPSSQQSPPRQPARQPRQRGGARADYTATSPSFLCFPSPLWPLGAAAAAAEDPTHRSRSVALGIRVRRPPYRCA